MPGSRKLRFVSFLIYGGVVLLLIYLAIFSRGFSQSVGQVQLTGHYAPLPFFGSKKIRDLSVSFHGISFTFSGARPLSGRNTDGGTSTFPIAGLRTFSDEAVISFENGVRIHLTADPNTESSYTISVEISPSPVSPAWMVIPYRLQGKNSSAEDAPVLSWSDGKRSIILSLPQGSRIDSSTGSLLLAAGKPGLKLEMHASAVESSLSDPYASWLSIEASLVGPESLKKAVSAFTDAAFSGWSQTRMSPDGLSWKNADGSADFREETGRAFISESIPRGAYLKNRAIYQQALAQRLGQDPQGSFTLSTSPFIGNLKEYQRRIELNETLEVNRIRGLLSTSDALLLKLPYPLIPFLLDHGPFSLVQEAIDHLRDMNPVQKDAALSLGMTEAFLDFVTYVDQGGGDLATCRSIIEKNILPSIRSTDKGIFLTEGQGATVNIPQSLRAASLLVRADEILSLPVLGSIGRSLMASSLALTRDSGFLPETLRLSNDRLVSQEGSIAPESVYGYVALDRFTPREIPLYKTLGPGTWIWTAARIESAVNSSTSFHLVLTFPEGLPHYVVIQGVRPFGDMKLHGISWRSDPEYSQYSDGWAYDSQKKTVFLKLTGRKDMEDVEITY
jgi:hypothetical protein